MANNYKSPATDPNYHSSNPNDHTDKTFDNWDDIFEFQGRKDGANYSMLKDWLKKYCEVPKLKK